jgi:hypothetical protein
MFSLIVEWLTMTLGSSYWNYNIVYKEKMLNSLSSTISSLGHTHWFIGYTELSPGETKTLFKCYSWFAIDSWSLSLSKQS